MRKDSGAKREPYMPMTDFGLQRGNDAADVPPSAWRSRGYIPHFDAPLTIQHVTYHLADSLPASMLDGLRDELNSMPPLRRSAERRMRIQAWLDAGHGSCVLRVPAAPAMVQESVLHFDAERYRLLAWVVMPNHVHVLFEPLAGWKVGKIVASWKSYTGRRIAEFWKGAKGTAGSGLWLAGQRVWQREYWDRYIRNERHLLSAVDYIHQNPVRAGLVSRAEDWEWSSARLDLGAPREG
jgi:REP element-mobilizing transposase RayT